MRTHLISRFSLVIMGAHLRDRIVDTIGRGREQNTVSLREFLELCNFLDCHWDHLLTVDFSICIERPNSNSSLHDNSRRSSALCGTDFAITQSCATIG